MNSFLGGDIVLAANNTDRAIIGPFQDGDVLDEVTFYLTGAAQTPVGIDPLTLSVRVHAGRPTDSAAGHALGEPVTSLITFPGVPRITVGATDTGVQVFNGRVPLSKPMKHPRLWLSVEFTSTAAHAQVTGSVFAKVFRQNPARG